MTLQESEKATFQGFKVAQGWPHFRGSEWPECYRDGHISGVQSGLNATGVATFQGFSSLYQA